jgi:hypothetical protein
MNGYAKWIKMVDLWVQQLAGLSLFDLPDCCYADWYEDGIKAKAAAKKAIKLAGAEGF